MIAMGMALLAMPLASPASAQTTPSFSSPALPYGLGIARPSDPAFADIDADGDVDAFVGTYPGAVLFSRNTGSATAPAFAPLASNPFGFSDPDLAASPAFADIDADGDLDAFVGRHFGDIAFFRNTGTPASPAFASAAIDPFGLSDVGNDASPTFGDIDGDGDLDAFVGNFDGDTVVFSNTGSASAPAFSAGLTNPSGLAQHLRYSSPALADMDGDGDLDLFVGQNFPGDVLYIRNLGTSAVPSWAPASANPFGLAAALSAKPFPVDIDGDGDLDLLVGDLFGSNLLFVNTGSATTPVFRTVSGNPLGLSLAEYNSFAAPAFGDLDGDGDPDAVVGNFDGNLVYFRNLGSIGTPAFAPLSTNPFGFVDVGREATPALVDIDRDGDLDAFVGNSLGTTLFFKNVGSRSAPPVRPSRGRSLRPEGRGWLLGPGVRGCRRGWGSGRHDRRAFRAHGLLP